MQLWYLSHLRPAKAQASPRSRASANTIRTYKLGKQTKIQTKIRHLVAMRKPVCQMQTTKMQISVHICRVWAVHTSTVWAVSLLLIAPGSTIPIDTWAQTLEDRFLHEVAKSYFQTVPYIVVIPQLELHSYPMSYHGYYNEL